MTVQRFQSGRSRVIVQINDGKADRVMVGFAGEEAKRKANRVLRFAKDEAPTGKTGNLKQQIRVQQSREISGRFTKGYDVVSNADYSVYVHEGTRPHTITGNPLLSFFWPVAGSVIVVHSVQHPGTKANPFMARAVRRAR